MQTNFDAKIHTMCKQYRYYKLSYDQLQAAPLTGLNAVMWHSHKSLNIEQFGRSVLHYCMVKYDTWPIYHIALRQRQELQVHSSCSDDYFLKNSKMKITSISKMSNIYPCDTMLAWILAMERSVSVTSQCSVELDGRIRYDTIWDAILTCARKPTWAGLIYRTETTTKNCKTEKLKSRNQTNRKSLGNHVVSTEEEKERLQWEGRICRKRRF